MRSPTSWLSAELEAIRFPVVFRCSGLLQGSTKTRAQPESNAPHKHGFDLCRLLTGRLWTVGSRTVVFGCSRDQKVYIEVSDLAEFPLWTFGDPY